MPHTIRLHRVIKAPPERIYRAFTSPEALVKWLPPHGFVAQTHEFDARVGGSYRMSFINFSTNSKSSFGGEFLELLPGQRIRHTDRLDDPNLPGEMITTVDLKAVFCGTELQVVQEGVPDIIPAQACYLGWQESLQLLTLMVEPTIPDGA